MSHSLGEDNGNCFHPRPYRRGVHATLIGNITCYMSVFDGQRDIRFVILDDERFAFINDHDSKGEPLVIRTKEDLFQIVSSIPIFPVGTPAGWIYKILKRNIIKEFSDKLAELKPSGR